MAAGAGAGVGGGRVVLHCCCWLGHVGSPIPQEAAERRRAFLGCTSHAADLQQRAEFGEDYRIFGGVVTDDWVDAVQASSSLGLCDCVLASSGI